MNVLGGFGSYGLSFVHRLVSALKQRYGASLCEIQTPPPINEAEHRRITTKNTIASIIAWSMAFALPLLVTGPLSRYPLPNLHALPSISADYYSRIASLAAVSFPVTFLVCAGTSLLLLSEETVPRAYRSSSVSVTA
jgi:hypothetical protein